MSEQIGTFELDHVCNTYTAGPNNEITTHTNWQGTAEGYGKVFGTLLAREFSQSLENLS